MQELQRTLSQDAIDHSWSMSILRPSEYAAQV